jgi:hypothetical protein
VSTNKNFRWRKAFGENRGYSSGFLREENVQRLINPKSVARN